MRSSSALNLVELVTILLSIHLSGVQAERKIKVHNLVKVKENTKLVETNLSIVEVDGNLIKIGVVLERSKVKGMMYEVVFYAEKIGVCSFLNTFYKELLYDRLKEFSNAPDPSHCPLPEGAHYHLVDYPLDIKLLKTLLKPGHYRIELKATLNNLFYPMIYLAELELYE
ncbi:uncharacterized protein LOC108031041 [Drosophila biarmipes]|uniref:uncharacterized protein LOC108031041 n=1 Tax=Drosophila biarmipes TaxID=125945 RepID=UPI0007E7854D|nr:uncharacterized protein LOC108031041 [Drosophila biarmipes]